MSSNIRIQRICQFCNREFTAKTTVTKYCGDTCAKKAYKARMKDEKVEQSNIETRKIISAPLEIINSKEYLTVNDTCKLLSVSRWTIWRKIKNDELKASKIGSRIVIRRSELEKFLDSTRS